VGASDGLLEDGLVEGVTVGGIVVGRFVGDDIIGRFVGRFVRNDIGGGGSVGRGSVMHLPPAQRQLISVTPCEFFLHWPFVRSSQDNDLEDDWSVRELDNDDVRDLWDNLVVA